MRWSAASGSRALRWWRSKITVASSTQSHTMRRPEMTRLMTLDHRTKRDWWPGVLPGSGQDLNTGSDLLVAVDDLLAVGFDVRHSATGGQRPAPVSNTPSGDGSRTHGSAPCHDRLATS